MNSRTRTPRQNLTRGSRSKSTRRRRVHDPMLVFNMSIFNLPHRRDRIFDEAKVHENGT